eukprot:TRINITY_DN5713_c0_g1_i2.p1 TRINITY_DN5713_c0_g1~~TRINITY_DN5713_c0_g1_i2.p1  ORF type:complete len:388 (-),score=56.34 TRINITY_DN5713_c0_g1_i2:340-1437(-)
MTTIIVPAAPYVPAAGARSGLGNAGTLKVDASRPFKGVVGDAAARQPSQERRPVERCVNHRDGSIAEVLPREKRDLHMTGSVPSRTASKRATAVPGYSGHVEGKTSENVFGGTFRADNERSNRILEARSLRRATSAPSGSIRAPPHSACSSSRPRSASAASMRDGVSTPDSQRERQRKHGATMGLNGNGLNAAPHMPGQMTHNPGKLAETVHGACPGEVSRQAQKLRRRNPHVSCDGWSRKGQWPSCRRPTHQFVTRFQTADAQNLFSRQQQEEEHAADNKLLGHTFGFNPPKPNDAKAGDRYLHSLCRKVGKKAGRVDPSLEAPAGQPTYCALAESERWRLHHAVTLGRGNQVFALETSPKCRP